jgi:ornithine cyclodeaminase
VWSRTAERAAELCAYANGLGLQARRAHDPHDALRDADLIVTATAAAEPLFAAGAVRPGAFVAAVGACVPTRRELPAALIAAAVFVADDAAAARREAGDLLIAERELGRELPIAGTLGEFLAEPTREAGHAGATIVFESLGLGLEDVACAHYVVENAVGKEMGAARRP